MFVPGCLIMVALVVVWRVDDNQLLQTSRRHDCSSLFPFGPEWRAADSCLAVERGPLGSVAVLESIHAGKGVYAIYPCMLCSLLMHTWLHGGQRRGQQDCL
jgi:hypothetical protein